MLSDEFFHPDHVIPAVKLITALMENSNHRITQFFMKQHAVLRQIFIFRLWISNAGIDILHILLLQRFLQPFIQQPADTAPTHSPSSTYGAIHSAVVAVTP